MYFARLNKLPRLQVILLLVAGQFCFASHPIGALDTISLKEVIITDKPTNKKINRQQFTNLNDFTARRITNLLNDVSSVYLKNYGNGQLTSIAVRGTTAAQTEVMWNGIRINSPMLGQSDLALLNVGFHNAVSLQYNQLNSAIGCNLNFNNTPIDSGIHFVGAIRGGSFGLLETNMNVQYSNGKIAGATKVALLKATNNFPLEKNGSPQKQPNANVLQFGVFQELHLKLKNNHSLAVYFWWNKALRQIPATLHQQSSTAKQHDHALRTMLQWKWQLRNLSLNFTAAYLNEKLRYINPQLLSDDQSHTHALRNTLNLQYKIKRFTIDGNLSADYEKANSQGYQAMQQRGLAAISAKASYFFKQGVLIQFGARQETMNTTFSPFMPYMAIGYGRWFAQHHLALELTGKRSFRFPTMNDLFWKQSGNTNLKPEDSWNTELTINYKFDKWLSLSLSNYYTFVQQQIQWTPDVNGRWTPQNLKAVFARGAEINTTFSLPATIIKHFTLRHSLSYAYTLATQTSASNAASEAIGKQLIYVPRNRLSTGLNIGYRNFILSPVFRYTGIRFVSTDNQDFLPTYYLLDIELSKEFSIKSSSIKLAFRVNNITNIRYQDVAQRAMPGRNFEGTVLFNLK